MIILLPAHQPRRKNRSLNSANVNILIIVDVEAWVDDNQKKFPDIYDMIPTLGFRMRQCRDLYLMTFYDY